jgi:hypothetical protein
MQANGISLCPECHIKAENGIYTEAYLFSLINSNPGFANSESVRLIK